jgi:thioredoxin 1
MKDTNDIENFASIESNETMKILSDNVIETCDTEEITRYVINGEKLLVLDFTAKWCQPCKIVSETIREVSPKYTETVMFCKADADRLNGLRQAFNVSGLPTLLFIKKGRLLDRSVGTLSTVKLMNIIDRCLKGNTSEPLNS